MLGKHTSHNKPFHDEFSGREGDVISVIEQGKTWEIVVNGTYWTACSSSPHILNPKDKIKVVRRERPKLRLIIEPL